MDQSALPHQCFYCWLLECVWWKESNFFRQKILMQPAEVKTYRNNTPMLSELCSPPAPFQNWQRERERLFRHLLSVVIIINSHMLGFSLGNVGITVQFLLGLRVFFFNSSVKVDLKNWTSSKVTLLPFIFLGHGTGWKSKAEKGVLTSFLSDLSVLYQWIINQVNCMEPSMSTRISGK